MMSKALPYQAHVMAQTDVNTSTPSINHKRGKKRPATKSLQQMSAVSEMIDCSYPAKCDNNSVEWTFLPLFSLFSLAPDGSFPKVKDSTSSFIDLRTGDHMTGIASGRAYRIYI